MGGQYYSCYQPVVTSRRKTLFTIGSSVLGVGICRNLGGWCRNLHEPRWLVQDPIGTEGQCEVLVLQVYSCYLIKTSLDQPGSNKTKSSLMETIKLIIKILNRCMPDYLLYVLNIVIKIIL